MTSNVLMGRADPSAFGQLLDTVEPDVLVIQELGHNLVPVVEDRFSNHTLHPSEEFIGRGIATNLDASFDVIEMPLRLGTSAAVHIGEQVWNVVGVHLANPIDWPFWQSMRTRTSQMGAIESWLKRHPDQITVVAGDMNASPAWPAYRRLTNELSDVVSDWAAASGSSAQSTWGWRPGWPTLMRIDHVLAKGVTSSNVEVHHIEGSDHRALVVDLHVV